MRTPVVLLVSLFLAIGLSGCGSGEAESSTDDGTSTPTASTPTSSFADSDVQRLHDRMMGAMDPDGDYLNRRYLAFTWVIQRAGGEPLGRSHRWDRWSGDVRVDGPTDQGQLVAVFNSNSLDEGRVWLDGTEIVDDSRSEWLGRAHGMHINDSYWLVMPYKWADPGVNARYLGEESDAEGATWEVVELSFESVGRTPQNVYHAHISPASGLMERWAHYRTADADPSYADWREWTDFGGVQLPLDRALAGDARLYFEDVALLAETPSDAFIGPTD